MQDKIRKDQELSDSRAEKILRGRHRCYNDIELAEFLSFLYFHCRKIQEQRCIIYLFI